MHMLYLSLVKKENSPPCKFTLLRPSCLELGAPRWQSGTGAFPPAAPPRPLKDGCRVGLRAVEKNLVNVPWWQVANVLRSAFQWCPAPWPLGSLAWFLTLPSHLRKLGLKEDRLNWFGDPKVGEGGRKNMLCILKKKGK